jgi:hypothetical protein
MLKSILNTAHGYINKYVYIYVFVMLKCNFHQDGCFVYSLTLLNRRRFLRISLTALTAPVTELYMVRQFNSQYDCNMSLRQNVALMNAVFLDVTRCGSCNNRRSEERITSIIRLKRISELTMYLADSFTRIMEVIRSSDTSVLTRATRRYILGDDHLRLSGLFLLVLPSSHEVHSRTRRPQPSLLHTNEIIFLQGYFENFIVAPNI